ncbi:YciI family protein [Streptomyces sp. FXJ1.172]|uniref:YciI family protein n=1 Tax=Streptomyces sp. FXJ1.172 TaxID=710705 RepID=UPI000A782D79|nr:YciI family protein [Streptomyces sp. FXJ1.172]WEO99544.1 YciI family protein [Streptomyces sp. FXJ1.172]
MFVIVLKYCAPLETIDALKEAHYANPDGVFAKGMARMAGPLEPRTGGVIIADGERAAVEAAVASDPFVISGAATADILPFRPVWTAEPATVPQAAGTTSPGADVVPAPDAALR